MIVVDLVLDISTVKLEQLKTIIPAARGRTLQGSMDCSTANHGS